MSQLRKQLRENIPHLIWGLAISIVYSMFAYYFSFNDATSARAVADMMRFYAMGMLLLIPLVLFSYSVKKAAHIWQFFAVSVVSLALLHLLLQNWFYTIVAAIICLLRAGNRIRQQLQILEEDLPEESMLDHPAKGLLALPVVCFVAAGAGHYTFLQEMSLYHFAAMCVLFFVQGGLKRFEDYVRLAEMNAVVPYKSILETGSRIFVGTALVLVLFLVPIMRTQYTFVDTSFEFVTVDDSEILYEEETIEEGESATDAMWESIAESEPLFDLSWLWAILDKLLMASFYCIVVYCLYRWFKMVIVNFNKTQVEKNDVIESTLHEEETGLAAQRRKERFAAWFDFSERMQIRRRYKRQLRQYKPKAWQSPTEIERMAGKEMPELHVQYEDARYGRGAT